VARNSNPYAHASHCQRGRQTPTVGDTTGGKHQYRVNSVDARGHKGHGAYPSSVPSGLVALGYQKVDAGVRHVLLSARPDLRSSL